MAPGIKRFFFSRAPAAAVAIVLGAGLGPPGWAVVGLAQTSAQASRAADNVPGLVDLTAFRSASAGPVVATGTLVDAAGQPSVGMVAALVLPGEKVAKKLGPNDHLKTPTVGWTATAADGSFTLHADAARVPVGYWASGRTVNLLLLGWNGDKQGQWMTPADLGSESASTAGITIELDQPIGAGAQSVGTSATAIPDATACVYTSAGWYIATSNIGESQPRYASSWMSISSSHTLTVGVAASANGGYGTWKASGTYSTTTGFSLTWSASPAIRVYQADIKYGKYRNSCSGSYITQPIGPTSGNHTVSDIRRTWCGYGWISAMSAGVTFTRSTQGGSDFSESAGVDASGVLGIDLSIDSAYASGSSLSYRFPSNSYLCGSNNYPAWASRMSEYP